MESAVVVKLSGDDPAAGEVVEFPAASAEVPRMKYVVFGDKPLSVTECVTTGDASFVLSVSEPEFVPYDTVELLASLVDHDTTAVVAVGAAPMLLIVGAITSMP